MIPYTIHLLAVDAGIYGVFFVVLRIPRLARRTKEEAAK